VGVDTTYEIIYTSNQSKDAIQAIRQDACGFILKPMNVSDIIVSVESAMRKLSDRIQQRLLGSSPAQEVVALPHKKLMGIPTLDGIDFLYTHEIVRCEGLQKCTRIISTRKVNMISAYNIGEFRRMLEQHGFFSCHKSHLINLMHVKKFSREGYLFLIDNVAVPLARRKRFEFLDHLNHI
jgi:two-component system LytT family response regulator